MTRHARPRRGLEAVGIGLGCLLLGACGSLVAPFEGLPRDADPGVVEAGPRVAVCYNAMFSTPQAVRRVAEESCGAGTIAQPAGQDMRLDCPLLTPVRATFICAPE
jgi:hypothetical protein